MLTEERFKHRFCWQKQVGTGKCDCNKQGHTEHNKWPNPSTAPASKLRCDWQLYLQVEHAVIFWIPVGEILQEDVPGLQAGPCSPIRRKHNLGKKILPQPIFLILVHHSSAEHVGGKKTQKSHRIKTQTPPLVQRKHCHGDPADPDVSLRSRSDAAGILRQKPSSAQRAACQSRPVRWRPSRSGQEGSGAQCPSGFLKATQRHNGPPLLGRSPRGTATRCSHLSWKTGLISLQRVSKIREAMKRFTAVLNLLLSPIYSRVYSASGVCMCVR